MTSDVVLTHDLVDCPADGLVIGAANVTVNLNGHRISGPGASGSGIRDEGHSGLRVHGGLVERFDTGIEVENAGHVVVAASRVRHTSSFGILLAGVSRGRVTGSTVARASSAGIQLVSAEHLRVLDNALTANGDGISLYESDHNVIVGNQSSDSGAGIALLQSGNNRIAANATDREGDTGVLLDDHSDANRITDNRARANAFAGIAVGASAANTVRRNRTDDNLGAGIAVVDDADGTLVIGNRADRNGSAPPGCVPDCPLLDDGIFIGASATLLRGNHADENADLGIDAARGVEDGGRNLAHRNGDPRQCRNVICTWRRHD